MDSRQLSWNGRKNIGSWKIDRKQIGTNFKISSRERRRISGKFNKNLTLTEKGMRKGFLFWSKM